MEYAFEAMHFLQARFTVQHFGGGPNHVRQRLVELRRCAFGQEVDPDLAMQYRPISNMR